MTEVVCSKKAHINTEQVSQEAPFLMPIEINSKDSIGQEIGHHIPQAMPNPEKVIAAGKGFFVQVQKDGTCKAFKTHANGARICKEINDTWTDIKTISARGQHIAGLKNDGTCVYAQNFDDWDSTNYHCDVSDWTDIVAITASYYYIIGIKSDGTRVFTGKNKEAAESRSKKWKDIVKAVSGGKYSLALKSDGTVTSTMGSPYTEELGQWADIVDIAIETDYSFAFLGVKSDGTVIYNNGILGSFALSNWTDIVKIFIGNFIIIGIKSDRSCVIEISEDSKLDKTKILQVEAWTDIVDITFEDNQYPIGLRSDGTLVSINSRLNFKSNWKNVESAYAGKVNLTGLSKDGRYLLMGSRRKYQDEVNSWPGLAQFKAGVYGIYGLCEGGTVRVISTNSTDYVHTEEIENLTGIKEIYPGRFRDADEDYLLYIRSDGTCGYVGTPGRSYYRNKLKKWSNIVKLSYTTSHSYTPHILGLRSDGTVEITVGDTEGPYHSNVRKWTGIKDICVCKSYGSVGLKENGTCVVEVSSLVEEIAIILEWTDIVKIASTYESEVIGLKADGTTVSTNDVANWSGIVDIFEGEYGVTGITGDGHCVCYPPQSYYWDEKIVDWDGADAKESFLAYKNLYFVRERDNGLIPFQRDDFEYNSEYDWRLNANLYVDPGYKENPQFRICLAPGSPDYSQDLSTYPIDPNAEQHPAAGIYWDWSAFSYIRYLCDNHDRCRLSDNLSACIGFTPSNLSRNIIRGADSGRSACGRAFSRIRYNKKIWEIGLRLGPEKAGYLNSWLGRRLTFWPDWINCPEKSVTVTIANTSRPLASMRGAEWRNRFEGTLRVGEL